MRPILDFGTRKRVPGILDCGFWNGTETAYRRTGDNGGFRNAGCGFRNGTETAYGRNREVGQASRLSISNFQFPISNFQFPGLYVHIPFCKTKCPYCDFYSVTDLSLVESWLDAIEKEMSFYRRDFTVFDSLYIGGGTPTILSERQIERLMDALRRCFVFLPDTEITVEANPDDITVEKMEGLQELGVNRLSIGVQSFNEKELLFLKRRHTGNDAEKSVKLAKSCGFSNIGIDLMFGFPGQTGESLLETIEMAVGLEPAHLSCYQFTLEGGTPFGRLQAEGRMKSITEEEERKYFLFTSRVLKKHGYIHYEVSNYGKGKKWFSRHNQKYWRHVPYLGLGPAAHSFKDGVRQWNFRSVEAYCRSLSQGERPVEGSETLSPEQLRLERLYLGFRTDNGVSLQDVCESSSMTGALSQLRQSGFVKIRNGRIIPTQKGYLIADRLPLMLIE